MLRTCVCAVRLGPWLPGMCRASASRPVVGNRVGWAGRARRGSSLGCRRVQKGAVLGQADDGVVLVRGAEARLQRRHKLRSRREQFGRPAAIGRRRRRNKEIWGRRAQAKVRGDEGGRGAGDSGTGQSRGVVGARQRNRQHGRVGQRTDGQTDRQTVAMGRGNVWSASKTKAAL